MKTLGAVVLSFVALSGLGGCDKLKGKDADGGATSSSSSSGGGGILSFLGSDFEGEITMLVSSKKSPQDTKPLVMGLKKPKYRVDMPPHGASTPAQNVSVILDIPAKKAMTLMHASKTAMVIDLDQLKNMKGQLPSMPGSTTPSAPSQPNAAPPTFTNTGKKDTVAGYTCDIWTMTSSDGKKGDACLAEGITWVDLGAIGGLTSLGVFASEANHFPLRFISYDASGVEESRVEATKIEKKKLDDAEFVVPADYKVMDMAAMMNGMMGGKPPVPPRQH